MYDESTESDGLRVLVDRLWPRGVSKERAAVDVWAKELAPSHELRQWYHGDEGDVDEFAIRYAAELEDSTAAADALLAEFDLPVVTFLTATKDPEQGHPAILRDWLLKRIETP